MGRELLVAKAAHGVYAGGAQGWGQGGKHRDTK